MHRQLFPSEVQDPSLLLYYSWSQGGGVEVPNEAKGQGEGALAVFGSGMMTRVPEWGPSRWVSNVR